MTTVIQTRTGGRSLTESVEPISTDKEVFRTTYAGICWAWPSNGINCTVEWTSILTDTELQRGRISQRSSVIYKRDDKGICILFPGSQVFKIFKYDITFTSSV